MAAALKVLAIAVASGRVAYVYLVGDQLKDWRVSEAAARSSTNAAAALQRWINTLRPDVVVTERLDQTTRKGRRSREIIEAMARTASHNYLLDVSVRRIQQFKSKYEEAADLVTRFPALRAWLPKKRRFYDTEPRNIVLFEALALFERMATVSPG